jgi:hypothetical protein
MGNTSARAENVLYAQITEAIQESDDTEVDTFARLLLERHDSVATRTIRSYLYCVGFGITFGLLMGSEIRSFSLFGVTFERSGGPIVILWILSAFFFYHTTCLAVFNRMIVAALHACWHEKLKAFATKDVTQLLLYPSLWGAEAFLEQSTTLAGKRIAFAWSVVVAIVVVGIPLLWFVVSGIAILASGTFHIGWALPAVVTAFLLVARATILIWHYIVSALEDWDIGM